ncbi:hypothetical protein HPB51_017651 [Rhipicephalus microplus]|uniref:CCHC-type domain-containing protein n=1 Tax=Rhipicephalus microplus TaxID=6941 RepID=A0A9J6E311_RHIMP|nr:hypothetical protein HPB51_017651 [Rhipicephalus microplus]
MWPEMVVEATQGRQGRGRAKTPIICGGRMPPLPNDKAKIIGRLTGGLNIKIVGPTVVVEATWKLLGIDSMSRNADTMCPNFATKHHSRSGRARPQDRQFIEASGLSAKRLKNTSTVVVVFGGYRVPNYVSYGSTLVPCTMYRKQVEVCYACGRLGHRADLCLSPDDTVCRGCGVNYPDKYHTCDPKANSDVPGNLPAPSSARRGIRCHTL